MKTVKLKDKIIYRADEGKKVRFAAAETLYSEVSVGKDDTRKVEEVKNGNS